MDHRDAEADGYGDERSPPSYYVDASQMPKYQVATPLLDPNHPQIQMQQLHHHQMQQQQQQPGPKPGDQLTVVTMAAKPDEAVEPYGYCHLVCSFISVVLCTLFGLIALVCAMLGYTDYRTANFKRYRKKRCCAICWTMLAMFAFGGLLGIAYYLQRNHHFVFYRN